MNNPKKKKPVSPIYTIGAIWLLFSLFRPISTFARLLLVVVLSAAGYGVANAVAASRLRKKEEKAAQTAAEAKARADAEAEARIKAQAQARYEAAKPKYSPEVQTIVDEGARAHKELERLYASIPDLAVKRKVREIIDVSDKIVADAIADPSDVPQIKKFFDYYLPTTIKLLNAYDRMGQQGIEGENITGTMKNIEGMLDTAIDAYKKLLDSLFANQAMDIETDIQVMNTLLRREGFSGNEGFGQVTQR